MLPFAMVPRRMRSASVRLTCVAASLAASACATSAGGDLPEPDAGATDAASEVARDAAADAPHEADAKLGPQPTGHFVVQHVYFGDTDRSDVADTAAWRSFGLDLDGKASTAQSSDTCTPYASANAALVATDGEGGIDNSFGENLMPAIKLLSAGFGDFGQQVNANFEAGGSTILFRTNLLDGAEPWVVREYLTAPHATAPTFDGRDVFAIDESSLAGGSIAIDDARVMDTAATLVGDTLTMHPYDEVLVAGSFGGASIQFHVHHARVVMKLDATRMHVVEGALGGILRTNEFLADLHGVLGTLNPSFCSGSSWDFIVERVHQSEDILADGTNRAGVPCDAISVGLGFRAVAASYQGLAAVPVAETPCP